MTALDSALTAAAALLWLEAVSVVCVLLAAPFVGWWAIRRRRKSVEDFERRSAARHAALRGRSG